MKSEEDDSLIHSPNMLQAPKSLTKGITSFQWHSIENQLVEPRYWDETGQRRCGLILDITCQSQELGNEGLR